MTQVSAPDQGEILASRYRLDTLLTGGSGEGHAVWRGTDNLLNRSVEIELRTPGGDGAQEMITAAANAGRIGHPAVIGVYDAVDEGERAFVVREWVEGQTLTQAVSDGGLEPTRSAILARAVADGVAAIHATGVAHGNITPEAVLIGLDSEITLTELQLDPDLPLEDDVRAIGGLLYASLTGHWPREATPGENALLAGTPPTPTRLPDAVYVDGRLCSPRQVRAGIPAYLDALTMDLLDSAVSAPEANELAAELRRYDIADPDLGPLTAFEPEPSPPRPRWKRLAVPVLAVVCLLIVGLIVAIGGLPNLGGSNYPISDDPTKQQNSNTHPVLHPKGAQILDPQGDGTELSGAANTIDGNPATSWSPAAYTRPKFGDIKDGMGVILDLGQPSNVSKVSVSLTAPGATLELRGADTSGDTGADYSSLAPTASNAPATTTFKPKKAHSRYLLIWITSLPKTQSGSQPYKVGIKEITVQD